MKKFLFIFIYFVLFISIAWGSNTNKLDKFFNAIPEFKYSDKVKELIVSNYPELISDSRISDSVNLNVILLVTLMEQESDFRWNVTGDSGKAKGILQLHKKAIQQCYIVGFKPSNKDYEFYFDNLFKFPLTQIKFGIEYLTYFYEYGGVDCMIRYWNNNDWYKDDIESLYQYYYSIWESL
jgi:hypothetical protein